MTYFLNTRVSCDDEDSLYLRNTIIERVTGIQPIESRVLNPQLPTSIVGLKQIILDVHVKDVHGIEYDIEMQTTYTGVSENMRFEFYGARILSNQLKKGKNYKLLKKVYQIIFINTFSMYKIALPSTAAALNASYNANPLYHTSYLFYA